jgi:hypothetical protein
MVEASDHSRHAFVDPLLQGVRYFNLVDELRDTEPLLGISPAHTGAEVSRPFSDRSAAEVCCGLNFLLLALFVPVALDGAGTGSRFGHITR